jgi:glyoxylase-like metal-dependent hydrolase (beta-lactamase superfamily II)
MSALAVPLIVLSLVQAPAAPRDLVARAVTAMGGESALRGLRNVTLTFYSTAFAIGQEETPESPPRATITMGTQTFDYAGSRQLAVVEIRNVQGAINRVRRLSAGGIGLIETNGVQNADGPGALANLERNVRRAPERLIIAALDNAAALRPLPPRTWRGETVDGVRYASGPDTVDLYFDRRSGLPVLNETISDDAILGDRRTLLVFTRWQNADGVLIPRQVDTEVNGRLANHAVATAVTANRPVADSLFVIPDSIRAKAQPANPTPTPVSVTLAELAPGVWRIEGGSHHSLLVDQGARGLVIVEAPQGPARMEAVLDTVRSRFPGKSIATVISTHHHWDHSGGIRTALANRLPVVTHARNASFVRSIASARKTVRPDALSRAAARPGRPAITGVEDSLVVGTGDSRVVAYRLPTAHVEGMLAVYVPAARLLFQSDIVGAATPPPAGSAELVRFARARGIAVERVAGGHGPVVPWADVERAAAPPPATAP